MNDESLLSAATERDQSAEIAAVVAKHAADAIFLMDAAGRITFANPAAERMFGWTQSELLERNLHDALHHHYPDGRPYPKEECPVAQSYRAGEPLTGHEDVFFRKDGSPIDVSCSNAPIVRNGVVTGSVLTIQDISARKAAEEALAESEARFRALAEVIPQLVWSTRPDGYCDYLNAKWAEYTGVPVERHYGTGWLDVVHPADRDPTSKAWALFVQGSAPYDIEYRLRSKDGDYQWFQARASAQRNEEGEIVRIFGTSTNISDLKAAEERQHLMTRELHHRVKNTLATVQAIIGSTARQATSIEEFYHRVTDRIVSLARTHTMLVNNEWGGATVEDLFRAELAAYDEAPKGRVQLEGPRVKLSAEVALALGMAAHELTTNAVKYGALSTPYGRVKVRWSLKEGHDHCLVLEWIESGGPPVHEPARKGFGTLLLERVLGRQLNGHVKIDYAPEGVHVWVEAPLLSGPSPEPDAASSRRRVRDV
ncbi:PAS domain S-box protein [Microvirga mediterraneensis]|uniref:Blue-light-activated histidine kinase n=1 Tax=Microvirga mediterraneensis TaxID=2754695 RepID=A0A838BU00_9HYPH|nr:PAS domain S-box protein [Microvirga mediterraneensis]